MNAYRFSLLIIISTLFFSCQEAPEKVNYFSNNAFGNPIVGKAGEHYKGVTYVAYQGELEDPYVVAYDHNKDEWIGPYKAGTSLLGKTPGKRIDNHGKPTLVVDNEGYIHVVFGGHGGSPDLGVNTLGNYNCGKQIHVKTTRPQDISEWEVVDNLQPFATYSQFLKMNNGDIYLFYRHGAHRSDWVYQVSKDNCRTFSPKVSFLKAKPAAATEDCADVHDSWYPDFHKGKGNEVIVAYNYHICKNMKPHYSERNHCYYMRFNTDNQKWYNVQGEELTLPISKEYADEKTIIVNTGEQWNHIGRACLDADGKPHVCWYQGDEDGSVNGAPKRLVNYRWTGDEWVGGETNLPVESRGEMLITSSNEIKYLLGSSGEDDGEVAWWTSVDNGITFTREKVLIENEAKGFTLCHFIRNAHPDAQIMASQKIKGTSYSQLFLLGENGPIQRPKVEAEVLLEFDR